MNYYYPRWRHILSFKTWLMWRSLGWLKQGNSILSNRAGGIAGEVDKALTISSWLLVFRTTTCHRHRENAVHYIPREEVREESYRDGLLLPPLNGGKRPLDGGCFQGTDKLERRCWRTTERAGYTGYVWSEWNQDKVAYFCLILPFCR